MKRFNSILVFFALMFSLSIPYAVFSQNMIDARNAQMSEEQLKVDYFPILMDAIEKNNIGQVREALQEKMDINDLYMSETPLTLACKKSSAEIVQVLLDADADPKVKNGSYELPVILAFQNPDYEVIVSLLVDNGADVCVENNNYSTPLREAYLKYIAEDKKKGMAMMKYLFKQGAYSDIPDEMGYTLLMRACSDGDLDAVRLFLDNSADPNFQNKDTLSPLKLAATEEIAELLKKHGAKR